MPTMAMACARVLSAIGLPAARACARRTALSAGAGVERRAAWAAMVVHWKSLDELDVVGKLAFERRLELHEKERVPSDVEEVVVKADAVDPQHLAPRAATRRWVGVMRASDSAASRAAWPVAGARAAWGGRERLAVDLSVRRQGQGIRAARRGWAPCTLEASYAASPAPPRDRTTRRPPSRRIPRGARRRGVLARAHDALFYPRVAREDRLDFPELDAVAAHFDLMVHAAEKSRFDRRRASAPRRPCGRCARYVRRGG